MKNLLATPQPARTLRGGLWRGKQPPPRSTPEGEQSLKNHRHPLVKWWEVPPPLKGRARLCGRAPGQGDFRVAVSAYSWLTQPSSPHCEVRTYGVQDVTLVLRA